MENELKTFLFVSLVLHAGIFVAASLHSRRTIYLNVPIQLIFSNPPASPAAPVPETKEIPAPPKDKDILATEKPKKKAEEPKPQPQPQEQTAAPQTSSRPLTPTSQISVESARFPYTYYTSQITRKIGRAWQWTNEYGQLKTVVYFRIQRDGNVTDVAVKTPSGDGLFDQQALRAVQLASPFPPLPAGFPESSLGVFFEFAFRE
jgi:protein TonB